MLIDVCDAVGIENNRDVASRLGVDEKANVGITDGSQRRQMTIVNRPGLTKVLLFVPEARHGTAPSNETGNGLAATLVARSPAGSSPNCSRWGGRYRREVRTS